MKAFRRMRRARELGPAGGVVEGEGLESGRAWVERGGASPFGRACRVL
jgi:hypothetical protein